MCKVNLDAAAGSAAPDSCGCLRGDFMRNGGSGGRVAHPHGAGNGSGHRSGARIPAAPVSRNATRESFPVGVVFVVAVFRGFHVPGGEVRELAAVLQHHGAPVLEPGLILLGAPAGVDVARG